MKCSIESSSKEHLALLKPALTYESTMKLWRLKLPTAIIRRQEEEKERGVKRRTRIVRRVHETIDTCIAHVQLWFIPYKIHSEGQKSFWEDLSPSLLCNSRWRGPGPTHTSFDERHTKSASSTDKNMTEGGGGKKRLSWTDGCLSLSPDIGLEYTLFEILSLNLLHRKVLWGRKSRWYITENSDSANSFTGDPLLLLRDILSSLHSLKVCFCSITFGLPLFRRLCLWQNYHLQVNILWSVFKDVRSSLWRKRPDSNIKGSRDQLLLKRMGVFFSRLVVLCCLLRKPTSSWAITRFLILSQKNTVVFGSGTVFGQYRAGSNTIMSN